MFSFPCPSCGAACAAELPCEVTIVGCPCGHQFAVQRPDSIVKKKKKKKKEEGKIYEHMDANPRAAHDAASGPISAEVGECISDYLLLGCTLEAMRRDWVERAIVLNGYDNRESIAAEAKADGLSVCQRMQQRGAAGVGRATVFVSLWLGTSIQSRLQVLEHFLLQHALDAATTFFWICDFSVRQTPVDDAMMCDVRMLPSIIGAIGFTLLLMEPWEAPDALKRVWCVYEVCHTQLRSARFELGMSSYQASRFVDCLAHDFTKLQGALSGVDIRQAESYSPADKQTILEEAEATLGIGALNGKVVTVLHEALAREATATLDAMDDGSAGGREARLVSDLADQLGRFLFDLGRSDEAEVLLRETIDVKRRRLGPTHEATLRAMKSLGWLLSENHTSNRSAALEEAEALLRACLDGRRATLGPTHADTLRSANSLGLVLSFRGELDAAEALFRDAYAASRDAEGETSDGTLRLLNALAWIMVNRQQLDEAEEISRRVAEGTEALLGRRHMTTITRLAALASVFKKQGKHDEADSLFAEVGELRRETGWDSSSVGIVGAPVTSKLIRMPGAAMRL